MQAVSGFVFFERIKLKQTGMQSALTEIKNDES